MVLLANVLSMRPPVSLLKFGKLMALLLRFFPVLGFFICLPNGPQPYGDNLDAFEASLVFF